MFEKLPDNLYKIILTGECRTVEFKEAKKNLPNSLFETICSMLNRNGGHIFLGVKDNGNIIGINKEQINLMKKEFANLCNNPMKLFPTVYLDIKEYTYDEKHILYIYVHESSDVHKTANKIYDRNQDGDFDITKNTTLISNLYIRKRSSYIENKIYPFATMEDLRQDLIDKVRIMVSNRTANHPWSYMTNEEMLRSAGLYERDLETGKEGYNLACILLLGKDEIILSALSYYRTDALLRIKDTDRYDDRDDIRTNLIESYERLINVKRRPPEKPFTLMCGSLDDIKKYAIISYFNLLLPPDKAISNNFFNSCINTLYVKSEEAKHASSSLNEISQENLRNGIEIKLSKSDAEQEFDLPELKKQNIPDTNIKEIPSSIIEEKQKEDKGGNYEEI